MTPGVNDYISNPIKPDDLNEVCRKRPNLMSQHLNQTSERYMVVEADQEFRRVRLAFAAERHRRLL
jgi:response regulator RpfG family c-di-GMP phosphodiesterase